MLQYNWLALIDIYRWHIKMLSLYNVSTLECNLDPTPPSIKMGAWY